MRQSKVLAIIIAAGIILSLASISSSQDAKTAVLNTRGACLKVNEYVALIKNEVKGIKADQTLRLIIDTMNETEAKEAVKQTGHTILETIIDKDKASTTYVLKVNK